MMEKSFLVLGSDYLYIIGVSQPFNGISAVFTLHVQCERGKVIGVGAHICVCGPIIL